MKVIYQILIFLTVITLFNSCSKDSSATEEDTTTEETVTDDDTSVDDDLEEEEINFEDISTLKDDTQFLEYVSQTLAASEKIINSTRALEILEIDDPLTEAQNTELATAMGYNDTASMNIHFNNQTKLWLSIINQFDYDSNLEKFELAYQETVTNWITSSRSSKTNRQVEEPNDCSDICLDNYYLARPEEKALKHFICNEVCVFGTELNQQEETCIECHTLVDFYLTIDENERINKLQCCEWLCVEDQQYWDNNCGEERL